MSILAPLAAGRTLAESLMLDTCTATRPGAPSTNTTTGAVTASSTSLYTGKCRVQDGLSAQAVEAAGRTATIEHPIVHVPVGAFAPRPGDVITITASATAAGLVGRAYRVTAAQVKSLATAHRLPVEEVTA